MSVFMTFCIIAPIFGVIGKNGTGRELLDIFPGFETPDITENGGQLLKDAEAKIKDALAAVIKKYSDIPFDISISANIGKDFVIDIESVRIYFSERPDRLEELAFALEKELGFMPEFKVENNE